MLTAEEMKVWLRWFSAPQRTRLGVDIHSLNPSSPFLTQTLSEEVGCAPLAASLEVYKRELEAAGFKIVKAKDVTEDWRAYTAARVVAFAKDEQKLVPIIGEE